MAILSHYLPLIISVAALAFTIQQFITQRKHNKISVKPVLFVASDIKNDINGNYGIKLTLTNNGLGPAFINDIKFYFNGHENNVDQIISSISRSTENKKYWPTVSAIAANESKVLLAARISSFDVSINCMLDSGINFFFEELEDRLNSVGVVIEYSSMYEKIKHLDTR